MDEQNEKENGAGKAQLDGQRFKVRAVLIKLDREVEVSHAALLYAGRLLVGSLSGSDANRKTGAAPMNFHIGPISTESMERADQSVTDGKGGET